MPVSIKVSIKLLGALHGVSGRSRILLELEKPTVKKMMQKLADSLPKQTRKLLGNPELDGFRPSMLIIVNGKEISALNGLETKLKKDDEIVVIPVSHGG